MRTKEKYRKLTDRQIIALFRYHNPKDLAAIAALGIQVKFYDKGCDRHVYRLGKELVMKIEDANNSAYDQTPTEIHYLRLIWSKEEYEPLRKHTAKLYYAHVHNRITLTPFYPGKVSDYDNVDGEGKSDYIDVVDLFTSLLPDCSDDFHNRNFRRDKDGTIVCIDLGYEYGASR